MYFKTLENSKVDNRFSYMYLMTILILNSVFNGEFTLLLISVFAFGSIIKNKFIIHKYIIKIISIHIIILFISMLMISKNIHDTSTRDIFRDMSYILGPSMLGIFSYYLYKRINSINLIFKGYVVSAIVVAIYHIILIIANIGRVQNIYEIRSISTGYNIVILGLMILITYKSDIFNNKITTHISKVILFSSLLLSFSRTYFIVLVCGLLMTRDDKELKNIIFKFIKLILKTIFIIFIVSLFLYFVDFDTSGIIDIVNNFIYKIMNSLNEIKITNYTSIANINNNWRGYESFKAIEAFKKGSNLEYIFGFGLGKLINLGLYIELNGLIYNQVSILHNGYIYILIKSGILGLVMYILYFSTILFSLLKSKINNKFDNYIKKVGISLVVMLLVLTYIVNGIYSKTMLLDYLLLLYITVIYLYNKREDFRRISNLI